MAGNISPQLMQLFQALMDENGNISPEKVAQIAPLLAQMGSVQPSTFGKVIGQGLQDTGLLQPEGAFESLPNPASFATPAAATPPIAEPSVASKIPSLLAQVGKAVQPAPVPDFNAPPAISPVAPQGVGGGGGGIDIQQLISAILQGSGGGQLPQSFGQQLLGRTGGVA